MKRWEFTILAALELSINVGCACGLSDLRCFVGRLSGEATPPDRNPNHKVRCLSNTGMMCRLRATYPNLLNILLIKVRV
ncbi:hypothetical protein C2869_08115 [Saccharobesus litoralis]|uniref:Uncharacterized protein n=1 Tax=Saccharobesus litoralis TaxID=2172099 RepID=A0A2S0VQB0_9ALTE|nr:hypothetical protein C2869_08115 [Saccharobesus litoralis]